MTTPTIPQELAALREIAARATPGAVYAVDADDETRLVRIFGKNNHVDFLSWEDRNLLCCSPRQMALIELMAAEIERLEKVNETYSKSLREFIEK